MDTLLQFTRNMGVSDVQIIPAHSIVIEERFRQNCEQPKCSGYGQSISCPPYSMLPMDFNKLLQSYTKVLVFKFDVPIEILETDQKHEVARMIHEVSASIEQEAIKQGYARSKGYAGGSCKLIFCNEFSNCQELEETGSCRFKDFAKVSLSGLGVNFFELSKHLGWQMMKDESGNTNDSDTAMMVGMVLLE